MVKKSRLMLILATCADWLVPTWVNKVVKDAVPDAGGTEGTQGNR